MPKFVAAMTSLFAVAFAFAGVGVAQSPSQTEFTVDAKVKPNKAGTKKKPQGVKIKFKAHWETPDEFEPPITQRAVVRFPKGGLYNGGKYPSCSKNTLSRQGLRGCPPGAMMGKATGLAWADDVRTRPKVTIVNGGAKRVYFYTVLTNPARVQAPVEGVIKKLRGKWSYELTLTVPQSLQIVAGVPIQLTDFSGTAGKKDWLATTSCPKSKKWQFEVETFFDNGGSSKYKDSIACRS